MSEYPHLTSWRPRGSRSPQSCALIVFPYSCGFFPSRSGTPAGRSFLKTPCESVSCSSLCLWFCKSPPFVRGSPGQRAAAPVPCGLLLAQHVARLPLPTRWFLLPWLGFAPPLTVQKHIRNGPPKKRRVASTFVRTSVSKNDVVLSPRLVNNLPGYRSLS